MTKSNRTALPLQEFTGTPEGRKGKVLTFPPFPIFLFKPPGPHLPTADDR